MKAIKADILILVGDLHHDRKGSGRNCQSDQAGSSYSYPLRDVIGTLDDATKFQISRKIHVEIKPIASANYGVPFIIFLLKITNPKKVLTAMLVCKMYVH